MAGQNVTLRALYGASTATTSDVCHIDIPYGCRIVGIDWSITPTTAATGDLAEYELSTNASQALAINDAAGILSRCSTSYILATNGAANLSVNKFVGPTSIFLPSSTRIYVHVLQAGTSSTRVHVTLHLIPG